MTNEEQEQLDADRAFKKINRTQKIKFLKAPVVVRNGQRFRIATQHVAGETRKRLARI